MFTAALSAVCTALQAVSNFRQGTFYSSFGAIIPLHFQILPTAAVMRYHSPVKRGSNTVTLSWTSGQLGISGKEAGCAAAREDIPQGTIHLPF
jgi:hypothetical protein